MARERPLGKLEETAIVDIVNIAGLDKSRVACTDVGAESEESASRSVKLTSSTGGASSWPPSTARGTRRGDKSRQHGGYG